jgi:acetyltransferase
VQEQIPREPGSGRAEKYVRLLEDYAATRAKKPIAFCAPTSHGHSDFSRALRAAAPHVSFMQEANKTLRAIAAVARRGEIERLAASSPPAAPALTQEQRATFDDVRKLAAAEPLALDEVQSKDVLRAYGIGTPSELLVTSPAEALHAAAQIGFPVVLKAVAATLTHKSDAGAVALNLSTLDDVAAAYDRIAGAVKSHVLAGMLVCQQVRGGLELVLGLHRDPEMGLVVMAGAGGVLLELTKDVAFCAPPVSRAKAGDLLDRTRAGQLLRGYRGSAPLDRDAVVDARVARGHMAHDLGDAIESVDVNPFVALPKGGLALDALMVLRRQP